MADIYSKKKRSEIMAKVRSHGTQGEAKLKTILSQNRMYMRSGYKEWGRPDFINKRNKIVVFMDSCFWHRCRIHGSIPKSNKDFWKQKLAGNVLRDRRVSRYYRKLGYLVIRVWEHELRDPKKVAFKLSRIIKQERSDD